MTNTRKVLAVLFSVISIVLWLAACSSSSTETERLQAQIRQLESKVDELEEELNNLRNESPAGDKNTQETGVFDTGSTEEERKILEAQLSSGVTEVVSEAAGSNQITEEELLSLAGKYMNDSRKETRDSVVDQIIGNAATTGRVMEKLAETSYYSVAAKVASSDKATEKTLVTLADKWKDGYQYISNKGYCRNLMAEKILANPNATSAVALELMASDYSGVVKIANEFLKK